MNTQCPRCKTRLTLKGHTPGEAITCPDCKHQFKPEPIDEPTVQRVVVTSIDIPMVQMIWLTIKAIPAILIGTFILWLIVVVIGGAILTAIAA
jgi:hypothetical protein